MISRFESCNQYSWNETRACWTTLSSEVATCGGTTTSGVCQCVDPIPAGTSQQPPETRYHPPPRYKSVKILSLVTYTPMGPGPYPSQAEREWGAGRSEWRVPGGEQPVGGGEVLDVCQRHVLHHRLRQRNTHGVTAQPAKYSSK